MWPQKIIKEVVVVEGKTDSDKLKKLFNVTTYETNGLSLSDKKLKEIKTIAQNRGIILFLDPDGPGEKIRKTIMSIVPEAYNCFISKNDIKKNSKKIGIAEAEDKAIINAFNKITKFSKNNQSLQWNEYLSLELDTKNKRLKLCAKLNISYCNHKQLFKRLNMLNKSYEEIFKLVNKEQKF